MAGSLSTIMRNNITRIIAGILLVLFFIPFGFFIYVYRESYEVLKSDDRYRPYLATKLYDTNGDLISELYDENRDYTPIGEIPDIVKSAFLAAEDQNFYKHPGIDLSGIARAVIVDIVSGTVKQGGSTITQQLVKQLYTRREKTLKRKVTELFITREFERRHSKDKILEMYLNQIYFGHGVYGVKSAARFYFDRDLDAIDAVEAALLAAIPSAPNRYSPLLFPRQAFDRHRKILYNLIYSGRVGKDDVLERFNVFWAEFLDSLRTRYPALGVRNRKLDRAPHFTEHVRRILVKEYGEDTVYRGGLRVYTTLDLRHQEIAAEELRVSMERQNRLANDYNRYRIGSVDSIMAKARDPKEAARDPKLYASLRNEVLDEAMILSLFLDGDAIAGVTERHLGAVDEVLKSSLVEGAFVAIDPRNGHITAMVGGSDSNSANQLNRAVQSFRQPGSAFKAFIYGAGIESKTVNLGTSFEDIPVYFKDTRRDKDWSPSNYGRTYFGRVLPRTAFAQSLNIVSVLIYQMVGGARIVDFASRLMGIPRARFEVDPTLALGTTEISPLEMARGFAVVAGNGYNVEPVVIKYILDSSEKKIFDGDESHRKKRTRVISEETSFLMRSIMRGVVDYGTGYVPIRRDAGFTLPAAGKTGTNTSFRDAWFVGFTPDLVAAVWLGCDSQKFTLMPGQSGAEAAAPVWGRFMQGVYRFREKSVFSPMPRGISTAYICNRTGKIAVEGCQGHTEYFLEGTLPGDKCNSEHSPIINIFGPAKAKRTKLLDTVTDLLKRGEKDEEPKERQ